MRLFGVAHPGLAKLLPRRGWVEASQLPAGNYTPVRPAFGRYFGCPRAVRLLRMECQLARKLQNTCEACQRSSHLCVSI